jgi:hypothetical protein
MGEAYEAKDTRLDRFVAALNHPNILAFNYHRRISELFLVEGLE